MTKYVRQGARPGTCIVISIFMFLCVIIIFFIAKDDYKNYFNSKNTTVTITKIKNSDSDFVDVFYKYKTVDKKDIERSILREKSENLAKGDKIELLLQDDGYVAPTKSTLIWEGILSVVFLILGIVFVLGRNVIKISHGSICNT